MEAQNKKEDDGRLIDEGWELTEGCGRSEVQGSTNDKTDQRT